MVKSLFLKEHDCLSIDDEQWEIVDKENLQGPPQTYMGEPYKLGLIKDSDKQLYSSYYIGSTWIDDNKTISVTVTPKLDNSTNQVDFFQMFATALDVSSYTEAEYFSKCYGIRIEEPLIQLPSNINDTLTPLLLIHFISLVKFAVKNGLKKGYITIERNLKAKVRGKINIPRNMRMNEIPMRLDRIDCQFQEFSINIPENKILKKALQFSKHALRCFKSIHHKEDILKYVQQIDVLLRNFELVDDEVQLWEVNKVTENKIYRKYSDAIKMAKIILKRYDFSIEKASTSNNMTPPFWIDMPRLYELYVYKKLSEAFPSQICFQVQGHGYGNFKPTVDYIKLDDSPSRRYIIDAKYKTLYEHSLNLDDIREISGYARDLTILKKLGFNNSDSIPVVPCIIIHPSELSSEDDTDFDVANLLQKQIKGYEQFYHFRIACPTLKNPF